MPYEKVGDQESVCIADEVPFEIPETWEWVRLPEFVNYVFFFLRNLLYLIQLVVQQERFLFSTCGIKKGTTFSAVPIISYVSSFVVTTGHGFI